MYGKTDDRKQNATIPKTIIHSDFIRLPLTMMVTIVRRDRIDSKPDLKASDHFPISLAEEST